MKNIKCELSQPKVVNAKPSTRLVDTKATGLYLEISPKLKKTWYMRTSINYKQVRYKIGIFPELGISDARKIAIEHKTTADAGGDPRIKVERKTKKKNGGVESWSLGELMEHYIDSARESWGPRSGQGDEIRSKMNMHVFPHIPEQTLALNVKFKQLLDVLEPLAKNAPSQFTKVQRAIRAVINHQIIADPELKGVALHIDRGEFVEHFKRYTKSKTTKHHTHVPIDDIPAFYAHFEHIALANPVRNAIAPEALLFALLTGARTGEILGHKPTPKRPDRYCYPMMWSEVDFNAATWTIPGSRTKNGYDQIIPLSRAALNLLRKVKLKTKNTEQRNARVAQGIAELYPLDKYPDATFTLDDIVFPSHLGNTGLLSNNAIRSQLLKGPKYEVIIREKNKAAKKEMRPPTTHGLRTSLHTFVLKADYSPMLASLCIAHQPEHFQQDTSAKNYTASQFVEERRVIMEEWGLYCTKGVKPKRWRAENITQLTG